MTRVIKILSFLSLLLAAIIFVNAGIIGVFVFGPKWNGISLVIAVMALLQGASWIVGANGEAYRAVGAPSIETKIMAFTLIFYVFGYLISIQQSFEAFMWTRLGLTIAAVFVHFWVMKAVFNINIGQVLRYILTISLICVIPIVLVSQFELSALTYGPFFSALLTTVLLVAALTFYERKGVVPQIYEIAKKAIG